MKKCLPAEPLAQKKEKKKRKEKKKPTPTESLNGGLCCPRTSSITSTTFPKSFPTRKEFSPLTESWSRWNTAVVVDVVVCCLISEVKPEGMVGGLEGGEKEEWKRTQKSNNI